MQSILTQARFMTAKEATAALGISLNTLYSYVSRGLIRSEETPGSSRRRRYLAEDIHALLERKDRRREQAKPATATLSSGDPILASSITLIDQGRLYYRGRDAVELAANHTFEECVSALWADSLDTASLFAHVPDHASLPFPVYASLAANLSDLSPIEATQVLMPLAESYDLAAHDLSASGVCRTGVRLFRLLMLAITGGELHGAIVDHLQQHWCAPPIASELMSDALILCADHGLDVASFTARCVASTGATPYGAISAAIAALQGPRDGSFPLRCESFLREITIYGRRAVANRLKLGEQLPGFGHELYPNGDPRARYLLERIHGVAADAPIVEAVDTVVQEMENSFALRPNVDFALATLVYVLDLPPGSSQTMFVLGRLAGWIAHIIEQYALDQPIRPRVEYTGKRVVTECSGVSSC